MCSQNDGSVAPAFQICKMSGREFSRFSEFIHSQCGIKLPLSKKVMLTSRLNRRLRALGMTSFEEYYNYIISPEGHSEELAQMIDVVTTNKTDFFRESVHFDILTQQILPTLLRSGRVGSKRKLYVWSAGCSSGEEPYTLAMVLSEFFAGNVKDKFSILATDISTKVLATARQGIYDKDLIEPVPNVLKHKYLMRGKNSHAGFFRVVPELRGCINFRKLNLMDRDFGIKTPIDIIFCRNVVIYFDRQTHIKLFDKFYNQLTPDGYLFIGHSESLHGINGQFDAVIPTVYKKVNTRSPGESQQRAFKGSQL